ncbi:MAG: hypothetical protein QMB94_05750, partial [Phycisphaerales bacterium]
MKSVEKQASRGLYSTFGLISAWVVIVLAIVLWTSKSVFLEMAQDSSEISESDQESNSIPDGLLISVQEELIGQIAFGVFSLTGDPSSVLQATPIQSIGPAGEISYAILLGSISGPEEGLAALSKITETEQPLFELLLPAATAALQAAVDGTPVDASTSALLEERLGWFGRLATDLPDPAAMAAMSESSQSSMMLLVALLLVFVVGGLIGSAVLL